MLGQRPASVDDPVQEMIKNKQLDKKQALGQTDGGSCVDLENCFSED